MTVSPFDHPLLSALVGDEEVARHFSLEAEIDAMLAFEAALAGAETQYGVIPAEAAAAIEARLGSFRPDTARLRAAMARDGVSVPELVRQLRAAVDAPHGEMVHFGAIGLPSRVIVPRLVRVMPDIACITSLRPAPTRP